MNIDNGKVGKFQFEIRYTPILNFGNIIKDIANPFSKLSPKFEFANEGNHLESLKLVFGKERYYIDCWWDRMILVSNGEFKNYKNENSTVIRTFFDLFKSLSESKYFGKVNNYIINVILVSLFDKKYEEIIFEFKNKYLSNSDDGLFSNINDIGIILEKNEKNKLIKTSIGPFSKKDIEPRSLFPFIVEEFSDFEKGVGTMMDITIFEPILTLSEIKYTELVKIINEQSTLFKF